MHRFLSLSFTWHVLVFHFSFHSLLFISSDVAESDDLAVSLVGSDSDMDGYPSNLGKRPYSELSPVTPIFSPLPDYREISYWDFKIRADGLLGDLVEKENYCLGESSSVIPACNNHIYHGPGESVPADRDFIDLSSPHFSDEQYFTPEVDIPVKPAFIITFSSSSSEISSSNVSSTSGASFAPCGLSSNHFNPPPPPVLNLEANSSQNEINMSLSSENQKIWCQL